MIRLLNTEKESKLAAVASARAEAAVQMLNGILDHLKSQG